MFLRPFSEDPAARPASALLARRATRPRAGQRRHRAHPAREGKFCVCFAFPAKTGRRGDSWRNVPFSAEDSRRAGFRRRCRVFRGSLHEAAPCACFALSFGEQRRTERRPRRDCCLAAKGRALCLPRVAGSLRFFSSDVSPGVGVLPKSAPLCAARVQKGVFSESAASCGVCAFSRAAGGPAYSKPRLRR